MNIDEFNPFDELIEDALPKQRNNFDALGENMNIQLTRRPAERILSIAYNGTPDEFTNLQAKVPDHDIQQCLDIAVNSHNLSIIKEIVEVQGVKPGYNACITAIDYGDDFIVDYLFKHGADVHEDNDSLVYYAATTNWCYLEKLAELGASDYTAIINKFITDDHTEVAIYMMENGAKADMETLSRASHIEDTSILKHLLTVKGMVPPDQDWIAQVDEQFAESKQLLTKALLQNRLQSKMKLKTKTKSRGMNL